MGRSPSHERALRRVAAARLPHLAFAAYLAHLAWELLPAGGGASRWALFAPYPIAWNVSVEAVVFRAAAGRPDAFTADTLHLSGPSDAPVPHLADRRSHRVVANLGHEGFGEAYRPYLAAYLCRTSIRPGAARPAGIHLVAWWTPIVPPWEEGEAVLPYRQSLGGFRCSGAPPP